MSLARALPPFLLILALVPVPAAGQQAAGTGGQPEVMGIAFEGNRAIPDDSLRLAIVNRETQCRVGLLKYFPPLCPLGVGFAIDRHYLFPRELPRDALRLELYYYQRGYREAQVDTALDRRELPGRDEVYLTFHVDEGSPVLVDSLRFVGLEDLPERQEVLSGLPLEEGYPLSSILLDATRDTLLLRLQNRGFAHADILRNIFIPNESPYRAEVEYDVAPGPRARFGAIGIEWVQEGEPEIGEELVRRMLPFREGDVYGRDEILQAQRNLFALDIIRSASVREDTLAAGDSIIPLTIRISEADVHRVRVGAGWSNAECLNAESQWTSRNFMGGARRLQLRGRLSNVLSETLHDVACRQSGVDDFSGLNWLLSAELFQPWLFSVRNSFTGSVFWERQSLPDVFIRRAVGANLALTRSLGDRMPLTLAYRPQRSTLEAAEVFFCTSFLVCAPEDVDVLQAENWLAPVGLSFTRSRTDNILNPSRGYQVLLDLEHASSLTGSDFAYSRVIGEASHYRELARRNVVASRLRMGWIGAGNFADLGEDVAKQVVHPQKRFYAGGANSVRGFAQNRLGPRVLTVGVSRLLDYVEGRDGAPPQPVCTPQALLDLSCEPDLLEDGAFMPRPTGGTRMLEGNLEYRFAFADRFQGVGFLDVGQVWGESGALSLGDLEWSPGLGVRYFSPIGPLRVDVGYRFRGGQELGLVTSRIRPYDAATDGPRSRICITNHGAEVGVSADHCDKNQVAIPWVRRDDLAVLDNQVEYGKSPSFLQRLQLHFSIGQAF